MKQRRGLSSIIGMVFFVIILASTLGYVTYTINLMGELNSSVIAKGAENVDKIKEDFEIVGVKIDGGKFNVTVQNTSPLPINFTRVWINNVTDNSWSPTQYDVKKIATPGAVLSNIGQDLSLQVLDTQAYSIKLVTQRGNSKEFFINSPSQEPLDIQLHAIPDTISRNFTTTILMTVRNNMSNNNMLLNLEPDTLNVNPACSFPCVEVSGPEPTSYDSLKAGEMAIFEWVYRLDGIPPASWTFTGKLKNGFAGNTASDVANIDVINDPRNRFILAFSSQNNIVNGVRYAGLFATTFVSAEANVQSFLGFNFEINKITVNLKDNNSGGDLIISFRDDGVDAPNTSITIPQGQTGAFDTGDITTTIAANSLINLKFDQQASGGSKPVFILVECQKIS